MADRFRYSSAPSNGIMEGDRLKQKLIGLVLGATLIAAVPANFVSEMISDHNVEVCEKVTGKYCSSTAVAKDSPTYMGPLWVIFAVLFIVVGLNMKGK